MPLTLYYHPFASFCQKVLVALYEGGAPFEPVVVDLQDPEARASFLALWPIGKFPVIRSEAGQMIPESTIIIEHLAQQYPGAAFLVPAEPEAALQARLWDRFFDFSVELPMQKIVADRLRAAQARDAHGVEEARAALDTAYGVLETQLSGKAWAAGEAFSMADCGACPALFYADMVHPFRGRFERLDAYFARLLARPSFARVVKEAEPYMAFFPR